MGKPDQESAAAEEARRATGDAAGRGRGGRLSARRKRETVLRLLRGEDLESVSRELGITAARAAQWRDQFLAAGQASLKSRAPDAWDEANRRLQAKIGELLMENELLYAKVDQLDTIEELRLALLEFKRTYNEQWMLEKYHYQSPAQVRRDFVGLDAAA